MMEDEEAFNYENKSFYNETFDAHVRTKYFGISITIIFGTMLSVSMVFAIIGNFMTITIILTKHKLRKYRTNLFLLNLAVADMLVGTLVIPFSLITLMQENWIFPEWFCDFNFCINCVCVTTSIHTLMFIAVHKYICISKIESTFQTWKCLLMIASTWIWSTIFAVLTTKVFSKIVYKPKTMQCGPEYPKDAVKSLILLAGYQAFNFFIPLLIMAFAYIRIFQLIRKSFQFRRQNSDRRSISKTRIQEQKILKTLFMVLVCYLLCFTPYMVYTFYTTIIKDKQDIPAFLNPLAYSFGCLNSACNPIIYAWRFPDFRRGYKHIICTKVLYILSCGKKTYIQDSQTDSHNSASREDYTSHNQMSSKISLAASREDCSNHDKRSTVIGSGPLHEDCANHEMSTMIDQDESRVDYENHTETSTMVGSEASRQVCFDDNEMSAVIGQ